MMGRQIGHMVRLIDDLLDVSRITLGKVTLKKERIDLRSAIDAAVETSRPAIETVTIGCRFRSPRKRSGSMLTARAWRKFSRTC